MTFIATADLQAELTRLLDAAVRNETLSSLLAGAIAPDVPDTDCAVQTLNRVNAQIRDDFRRREAIRQVLTLREQATKLEIRLANARRVQESPALAAAGEAVAEAVRAAVVVEQEHYARVIAELAEAEAVLRES